HHLGALPREFERVLAADAAAGPGDNDDAPGADAGHEVPPEGWIDETAEMYAGHSPPPCTSSWLPETYDASGEARNRAAPPMSSGVPIRPIGIVADTAAMPASPP